MEDLWIDLRDENLETLLSMSKRRYAAICIIIRVVEARIFGERDKWTRINVKMKGSAKAQ